MEWMVTILSGLGLLVLLAPVIMLLLTFFVLVPLAHFVPPASTVSRTSFACPVSKRRVSVAFLGISGVGTPTDVLSCSVFPDGERVRCAKGCLGLAETRRMPSPMVPPYALLADGVASRGA
jgi:hypothetical protein